ncbi:MAG: recombinase family protein [Chloroflexi bacterium]|nr:recombinase family protein [Chloroflexota bacterium]
MHRPFNVILVWKLSRFARNREDSILYKSLLKRHGVQVISINEPVDDSAAGKLLEGMIEVIDEFYSTNLAEDVLRGMAENASKGFYNGGKPPFGYKRVKVKIGAAERSRLGIDETEAPVVRRIAELALAGNGAKEIAKTINNEGARTRAGKTWPKTMVNKLLKREVYTGSAVWKGKGGEVIRCRDVYPQLIPDADFERIQELTVARTPAAVHPRTVSSKYLLSSMLHCAKCGASMIGCSAKSGKFHYYRCNNGLTHDPKTCTSGWVPKNKIESFVLDRLKEKILTDENMTQLVEMVNEEIGIQLKNGRERLDEVERQSTSVGQKLLKYFTAFENGTMSEADAGSRVRELRAEQERLHRIKDEILANIEADNPGRLDANQVVQYAEDMRTLLAEGTITEQKTLLKSFVRRIDFEQGRIAINYMIPMPVGECGRREKRFYY